MLTKEETLNILKKELPYLKSTFGVKRIGLFGSYSKGIQREDSDVDIIVEFEKPIGLKFVELADYIENILGKKVSLLTPEGIKSIRVKNVAEDIEKSKQKRDSSGALQRGNGLPCQSYHYSRRFLDLNEGNSHRRNP